MRKMYIGVSIILFITVLSGQIMKGMFQNVGIADIKTEEDIDNLNCGMYYIFGEDEEDEKFIYSSFTEYRESYIQDMDLAPVIIIGNATGAYSQDSYSFGQEIKVEKVIKGSGIEEGGIYFIYGTDGFAIDASGNPIYTNIKNVMKAEMSYLIFLEASQLNTYEQVPKTFVLFGGFFSYLNLEKTSSSAIQEPLENLLLHQIADNEFFASSERILDCIQDIKAELLQKYIL